MNFLYKEISLIFFIKEICGFFSIQPKEICGFFTKKYHFIKMNFLLNK